MAQSSAWLSHGRVTMSLHAQRQDTETKEGHMNYAGGEKPRRI